MEYFHTKYSLHEKWNIFTSSSLHEKLNNFMRRSHCSGIISLILTWLSSNLHEWTKVTQAHKHTQRCQRSRSNGGTPVIYSCCLESLTVDLISRPNFIIIMSSLSWSISSNVLNNKFCKNIKYRFEHLLSNGIISIGCNHWPLFSFEGQCLEEAIYGSNKYIKFYKTLPVL